jgi:hypothetical protein
MAGDGRLVAPLTIVAGGGRQYRDDALRAAKRVFNGGLGMVTLAGIGRVSLGYAQRALTSRSRLISTIRRRPVDVRSWLSLISIEHHDGRLCGDVAEVVAIHRLDRLRSPAHTFAEHIGQKAAPVLTQLGADPVAGLPAAINEIAKWKAVAQCEASHSGDAGYFVAAEERMEWQWHNVIWPFIEGSDFSAVLELACGHGRNTEYLRRRAGVIPLAGC